MSSASSGLHFFRDRPAKVGRQRRLLNPLDWYLVLQRGGPAILKLRRYVQLCATERANLHAKISKFRSNRGMATLQNNPPLLPHANPKRAGFAQDQPFERDPFGFITQHRQQRTRGVPSS